MKFSLIIAALLPLSVVAQGFRALPEKLFPEQDTTKIYTVGGYRHGISFFPKVKNPHVEYEAGSQLTFDKFHSAPAIYTYMQRFAEQYPNLVDIYQVATSYEGRPIYQMTVTNKQIGKPTDKPAAFFEGNRHSGEVSSAESVMWLMHYLLDNYGKDAEVTALVDNNTIYLRPINNPDGHNLYMYTATMNRSTVRPVDNDGDGLLDEDSPIDLNGDGVIVKMRYKDKEGDYVIDPRDKSGRIMKYVGKGKGDYKVVSEGIDHDGDGKIGEDGIGGLDLHRNYPENWRPMQEKTGHGWSQSGAGEAPLSENETKAVVSFLLENPNIYVVNSMDTRVPMHLRAPSTSAPEERMYPEDLKWYTYFDEVGKSITGYEKAGDVYVAYNDGRPSTPLFGHGPDFGYFYYGAIWYGDEIWDNAKPKEDLNGDGEKDELDQLIWDEKENGGRGFIAWQKYQHPQFGEVEIGGWDPKFFSQNAPSGQIERWAKNEALFNVAMLKHLPRLSWADWEVKKLKSYKNDSTDYRVRLAYRNEGKLPTALRQADLIKIVKQDRFNIQFAGELAEGEKPRYQVLEETLNQPRPWRKEDAKPSHKYYKEVGHAEGGATNTAEFKIRVYGSGSLQLKASVETTRAGQLPEKAITIQ